VTTYTKAFFGVAQDEPFNLTAAVETYEWVMANPEEAPFVVSKMLFDNTTSFMEYHKDAIEEVCKGYVQHRLATVRRGLSRQVSKGAIDTLAIVDEIAKAWGDDEYDRDWQGHFAAAETRRAQRLQARDQRRTLKPMSSRPVAWDGGGAMRKVGIDALAAMGSSPDFADYVANLSRDMPGALEYTADGNTTFADKFGRKPDDRGTTAGQWRRLEASSKLAYDMGGKYLPEQAQLALKAGEYAGKYEPQAERVIGPSARRAAYRYRGVEKKPDAVFQNDIDSLRVSQKGGRPAHEALIFGTPTPAPRGRGPEQGMWEDRTESRTIAKMKDLLPSPELYELNKKSGTLPPSQGIIINRSGKVITQAVGYGEDWYLPFNLRNLSQLSGGEYIRTRAYGGLTTEDVYVGLVSGARAVTVVSHSGTYTMEFDDNFRGARRFNDKAGRMHARYAQLLDAVKFGDVTLGDISPARKQELRDKVARETGKDPADITEGTPEFKVLRTREKANPKLAKADMEAAAIQALNESPKLLGQGHTGYRSFDDYVDQGGNPDPIKAAEELGAQREVTRAIDSATITNAENLNPLILNGRGYGKAMKALQDQFPYYIARAEYIAPGPGRTDAGYIKPRFIRPAEALSGYYDKTIEGKAKLHADRTNYQNASIIGTPKSPNETVTGPVDKPGSGWDYIPERERTEDKDEATGGATGGPTTPKTPEQIKQAADYAKFRKSEATMKLIAALREQTNYSTDNPNAPGMPVNPNDLASIKIAPVMTADLDVIQRKLDQGDPGGTIAASLAEIRKQKLFDVDPVLWDNYNSGGTASVAEVPTDPLALLSGIGTQYYKFPGLDKGRRVEDYAAIIDDLLASDPELQALSPTDKPLTAAATWSEIRPKVLERANFLKGKQAAIMDQRAGHTQYVDPVWNPAVVEQSSKRLARLAQAYKMRDEKAAEIERDAKIGKPIIEVLESGSPEETERIKAGLPKAGAPEQGADYAAQLQAAAAPHQEKLRSMIGMSGVAHQVDGLVAQAVIASAREKSGLKTSSRPMHLVFTGSPGTGKTTVAELIAPLYADLGLTNEPKVTTLTKSEITGPFVNQVEQHTRKALNDAAGGVIIIDEAYTLANDDSGRKAIEEMVPMLTKELKDTVVILAGYPDRMDQFMQVNEGLSRRFPKTITFRDYSAPEMKKIADKMLVDREYTATTPSVHAAINDAVTQLAARPNNGNGGGVENMVNFMRESQEFRLMKVKNPTHKQLATLTSHDVKYAMHAMGLKPGARQAA